jgi:hypothetical protein
MHGHETALCPAPFNGDQARACVWPTRLDLNASASGASFKLEVQVFGAAALVSLPGEAAYWPQDVKADGKPAAVVELDGAPATQLVAGRHVIEGRISWQAMPQDLLLPKGVGATALTVAGAMAHRAPDAEGRVWLRQAPQEAQSGDALTVHTTRLIDDQVPLQMSTQFELAIAGKARDLVLPAALLHGMVPVAIESVLPARLQEGGKIVVQARPGNFTVLVRARLMSPVQALTLPRAQAKDQDPGEEVWSFAAHNDVRLVSIEGVSSVDPRQVAMLDAWRGYPAYRMQAGDTMRLVQSRRGNPQPSPDSLSISRELWLDFDGQGMTVHDEISGTLSRSSRLDMAAPGALGRVSVDGEDQTITRVKPGAPDGFEVRSGAAHLSADSRLAGGLRTLPASGWLVDMNKAAAVLNLPPGWRLLHASGVDSAEGSWVNLWTLWDFFFVLLSALAAGKLLGWQTGAVLGLALVLTWHMPGAPQILWLVLLGLKALATVLPEGRLRVVADWGTRACVLMLTLVLLPYAISQIRLSMYPAMEQRWQTMGTARAKPAAPAEVGEAAPAPEPMMEESADAVSSSSYSLRGVSQAKVASVTAKAVAQPRAEALDPGAQVQTGPGLPAWQWQAHRLGWQGPLQAAQSLKLVLLPPWGTVVLRLVGLGLLVLALLRMAGKPEGWRWPPGGARPVGAGGAGTSPASATPSTSSPQAVEPQSAHASTSTLPSAGAAAMLALSTAVSTALSTTIYMACAASFTMHPQVAYAAKPAPAPSPTAEPVTPDAPNSPATPPANLLDELRAKLTAPPDCMPHCADVSRMLVVASGSHIQLRLEAHALADVSLPLPGQGANWLPGSVLVDGKPAPTRRDDSGALWVVLSKGVSQVVLDADVGDAASVDISLPLPVREVKVQTTGWTLAGLDARGLASGALSLSREQTTRSTQDGGTQRDALPPFVRIERTVHLGLRWTVDTRVVRAAPSLAPLRVKVPLLAGEAVNNDSVPVQDGYATVQLGADNEASFASTLAPAPRLVLSAAQEPNQIEVWRLDTSTQWHAQPSGIAPVVHQENGRWMPTWQPWPGEQVTVDVSKPAGVPGQTFTVDRVDSTINPGARASDVSVLISLRASQGGNHAFEMPPQSELLGVWIDGQLTPVLPQGVLLMVPITPGAHKVKLDWREPRGMGWWFGSSTLKVGAPGVNDSLHLNVPRDRVVLALGGPPVGPAVLFWGVLLVIVAVAIGLARWQFSPLSAVSWALLGVGVAQTSLWGMALVVGWFFAMAARRRFGPRATRHAFMLVQLLLALWALLAASVLLDTVRVGLLGYPDLMIQGNGSNANQLHWFADRFTQHTAQAWVVSIPVLAYRVLMLLWALWLAASMLRWVKWAWACFSEGGYWPTVGWDMRRPQPSDPFEQADKPEGSA